MPHFVGSETEALANIERFHEIAPHVDPGRLSAFRSWYAVKAGNEWRFGPSKFIGYVGLTSHSYELQAHDNLDGRNTEALLRDWFAEVPKDSPLYNQLRPKLTAFLGQFGKKPSALTRISVPKTYLMGSKESSADDLVRLLAAAYGRLSPEERKQFKDLIRGV